MDGAVFVYVDTVDRFLWVFLFMLSWMFQHDYLDTYCFEYLIYMCFVFLYLHLFSAVEHVSHERRSRNTLIIFVFIIIRMQQRQAATWMGEH